MANARLTVQNDVDVLQLLSEAKHAATQAMTACDALHDVLHGKRSCVLRIFPSGSLRGARHSGKAS